MENYVSSYIDLKYFDFISLAINLTKKNLMQNVDFQFSIGKFIYYKSFLFNEDFGFQTPDIPFNLKPMQIFSSSMSSKSSMRSYIDQELIHDGQRGTSSSEDG
jgi:hypothetical protein